MLYYDTRLKGFARELRSNMTDTEKLLWTRLRRKQLKGLQFHRQRIIGKYIVDFYCPKANLIIEVDGGQHYSDEGVEKDQKRDEYMRNRGLNVLRFSDKDVFENIRGVMERIYENV